MKEYYFAPFFYGAYFYPFQIALFLPSWGGLPEYLRAGGMGGINVFTVNLSGHFSILTPCPPLKWPTPKADVECRQAGMGLCFHFCLLSFNCCSSLCDLYMVLLFTVEVRQIKKLSGKKYFYRISFDPPPPRRKKSVKRDKILLSTPPNGTINTS